MGAGHEATLDERDRSVVLEALDEIEANPLPASRGPVGCLAALAGLAVLLLWPAVADVVPAGAFVAPFVLLLGAVLLLGGIAAGFRMGRKSRATLAAVEAALRQLEAADGDRTVCLRAATLLLAHAEITNGPTTVRAFDPEVATERIGGSLPLVLAVDRFLQGARGVGPVFGDAPGEL